MAGLNIAKPRRAARRGERLVKSSSRVMGEGRIRKRRENTGLLW